jgi:hypothetical protein
VSATQLDNKFDTQSYMLQWLPTDWRETVCSGRLVISTTIRRSQPGSGIHYTHSLEDAQSQPGTNAIENSQIRLGDGNVIFTPGLFGPGIEVDKVT